MRMMVAACLLVLACGGRAATQNNTPSTKSDGAAVVVQGKDMLGTVLEALRTRVPGMTVSTRDTPCPLIFFRGPRSVRNAGNVSVYIDRTNMADTCILQQISASDVERVEIYPSGNVSEPGIQRNPNGIIMVYRLRQ